MIKIATLIFLNFSLLAYAGNEGRDGSVGNGGNVLICGDVQNPDYNGRVLLLDFVEFNLSGRGAVNELTDPLEQQIDRALLRIKRHSSEIHQELAAEIQRIRLSFKANAILWKWASAQDTGQLQVPRNYCSLVAAYIHFDDGRFPEFNSSLYGRMSLTQQAGLWVHEGIYSLARKHAQIKTSEPVRLLTGYLFAMTENPEAIRTLTFRYLSSK